MSRSGWLLVAVCTLLFAACRKAVIENEDDSLPYLGIFNAKSDKDTEDFDLYVFKVSSTKVKMESTFGEWDLPISVVADVSQDSLEIRPQYIDSVHFVYGAGFPFQDGMQFSFWKINGKTETIILKTDIVAMKQ